MGIRRDRLAIRKIDDQEQGDDQRADRPDVGHAGDTQGDEQRQGRLGAVSRRSQGVEPEHRNARENPHALLAFFKRRQPAAEEIIGERHRWS